MNKNFNEKMIKDLHHFFKDVMLHLNHHGWTLRLCHDSYCWRSQKRIDVGIDYDGDLRQIMLHEIAHVDTAKYCNNAHNPQFWKQAEYLIRKFLKTMLDRSQLCHKKYCGIGFYRLVYSDEKRK